MPIGGPSTYLPTIDEFLAHWSLVDAALGSNLSLNNNYKRTGLVADRATMLAKITAANNAIDDAKGASAARDTLKITVKEKMRQFNQTVRGQIIQKKYRDMLPRVPSVPAGPGPWLSALDAMNNCWSHINTDIPAPTGFSPPLTLTGPYLLAGFVTDRTALLGALTAVVTAFENQEAAITDRDATMEPIRQRLIQYRAAVEGTFPAGNPLIASLPRVTPLAGSTPQAVQLTAVWDGGDLKAHLTWPATTDARVTAYEVRACFGTASYRTADESVIQNIPLGTEHYETDDGLGASGAFVWFKVYTQTGTGNEKGSNAVKVIRP